VAAGTGAGCPFLFPKINFVRRFHPDYTVFPDRRNNSANWKKAGLLPTSISLPVSFWDCSPDSN
jgi:hypothetical protein